MTNPDLIPVPFAQDGQKNTIKLDRIISDPAYMATWLEGFPPDTRIPEEVGGEAPDGLDFNGLFNALSQAVVFLQKGNAYQFDVSLAPYPIGALVRSNDNLTTYQSTVAANSNDPNSNMTGWRVYNSSSFIADDLTTNDSAKALSAKMGKKLQDEKFAIDDLVNNLTSGGIDKALTAEQGKQLFSMFANSLGPNGRQKIPNPIDPLKPLMIQWATSNATVPANIQTEVNLFWPVTFNQAYAAGQCWNVTLSNSGVFVSHSVENNRLVFVVNSPVAQTLVMCGISLGV